MQFTDIENSNVNDEALIVNTSWDPDEDGAVGGDWDDEEDEDLDDRLADLDDLHEIQIDEDLDEPSEDDDDHFPEDDE